MELHERLRTFHHCDRHGFDVVRSERGCEGLHLPSWGNAVFDPARFYHYQMERPSGTANHHMPLWSKICSLDGRNLYDRATAVGIGTYERTKGCAGTTLHLQSLFD